MEDVQDIRIIKSRYKIPTELQSCHTTIMDGYVIEGHVPVREINRLLSERLDVIGLAVPGMPAGSLGMENAGVIEEPYGVAAFSRDGRQEIFASYPK